MSKDEEKYLNAKEIQSHVTVKDHINRMNQKLFLYMIFILIK